MTSGDKLHAKLNKRGFHIFGIQFVHKLNSTRSSVWVTTFVWCQFKQDRIYGCSQTYLTINYLIYVGVSWTCCKQIWISQLPLGVGRVGPLTKRLHHQLAGMLNSSPALTGSQNRFIFRTTPFQAECEQPSRFLRWGTIGFRAKQLSLWDFKQMVLPRVITPLRKWESGILMSLANPFAQNSGLNWKWGGESHARSEFRHVYITAQGISQSLLEFPGSRVLKRGTTFTFSSLLSLPLLFSGVKVIVQHHLHSGNVRFFTTVVLGGGGLL